MLEIHPGVFAGSVNARVREALWDRLVIKRRRLTSAVLLLHNAAGEQGFTMLAAGTGSRRIADFDGLLLLRRTEKRTSIKSDSVGVPVEGEGKFGTRR
jgi:CRISPR-associated endoribonuclease Cas2 subtype I-E